MSQHYVNLTPHAIALNDGRVFEPSGAAARVSSNYSAIVDDVASVTFGQVDNLPAPTAGTRFIVSTMVLSACAGRDDVVAPATDHPEAVRNDKGHIVSVPCFKR